DNNNMTIAELKNKNIINSFDWSLNMFGEGSVDYRGVLGGITPNYVSHTANLTNFNPKYINKGIKWVAPEGGSELHDICWNAHIDENKIILKNGIDGLYLYFLPESIKVENYFFGNHYSFGGHNDIIKGDFNMFNNNPGFKINPYQADVVNEGLENLLFLDGEAYNQEKYKDFKVDLVLKNIKFENGNTSYINENSELCGVISYAIIIEDLRNGASKMFDLDDAFLEKNITEEMLFEVIKKLDYIYGRLQVNIIKYTLLLTANVIHTIASVTVQTALLVYQILNLVKIVVAAASLPWSTMLFLYFIVELASTINAAIELILFLNEKINYITELIIHIANLLNFNIKTNEKVKLIDDFHIRRMKELKGAYNYIDLIGLISVIGFRQIENLISSINIRFVKKISKDILDTSKDLMNNSLGNYFEKILKINNKVKTFKMEKIWGVSVVLILMVINFGINIAFDSSVELILFLFDYEDKK
ncbi:MAG: hypothetical protein LBH55_03870, partial [Mycoplasmataceae bacterium]|nr:hypothetical protein [Mycoplasmataceae bacterium]